MKQRLFLTIAALLCLIAGYAGNLAANDITMKPGETTALELSLASSVSGLYGVQFEIKLPEGFSLEKGNDDQVYKMSANQADDLTCSELDLEDGVYRFIVYSSTLQELKGGSLMCFNLKVDDSKALGNYTITISNVALSDYEGNVTKEDGISVSVKVTDFFTLLYKIDGEDYKSFEIEYGTSITPEAEPTKEGYSFSGWSEIPSTMPANDVTVTGTFTKGAYMLTYIVDGVVYKTISYDYGTAITPEAAPTREGYTFSGWSEIPSTMPAKDVTVTGTFTINKYRLIYMVDGAEYKSYEIEYGANITSEAEPTKEGYTFSGWSWIPSKMPAENVIVTGMFNINKYKLTYLVNGEIYDSYNIEYGASITPETEPTKEGYTFSGWSEIPSTMPAKDVTITGDFTANMYKLTYMVEGEIYDSYDVEFGASISPENEPTMEGYTFSGWSDIPKTMPAEDVVITGMFTINKYKITYMIDGELYLTAEVEYGAKIQTPTPAEIEGYDFEWGDYPSTMPADDITIYGTYTATGIEAILVNEPDVKIFTISGRPLKKLQKGVNIVIPKDGKARKVIVK